MKHAKTAALIAGSVVALGTAVPAFAAEAPGSGSGSASDMVADGAHAPGRHAPGGQASGQQAPDSPQSSPLGSAGDAANSLTKQSPTNSTPLSQLGKLTNLGGAVKGVPLLGGLPIG